MQFHLNGFKPGDPSITDETQQPHTDLPYKSLPSEVDVLIVGCGPAGLTLAAQLAVFSGIRTAIADQKNGPLQVGQADGIAVRSVEMFEAFGFAERVLKESYWVNETAFWKPDPDLPENIKRSGRIQDTEDGLSEFPHVILNQARVHDFYLDKMRHSVTNLQPHYSRRLVNLQVQNTARTHPVTARFESTAEGHSTQHETIKAKYLVGCDGARSAVRKSLGLALHGDSANHAWGVMDILAVTDFPDIRCKCVINSAVEGSIVVIPREGGYMVRLYIELDKLNPTERVSGKNITVDQLIAAAQRIFNPYQLSVKEVAWWSVYEIGQRLCDTFDNSTNPDNPPNVFIAGDACHTHSPKAGQGMNVSMRDSFNLGWKLASVLEGRSNPALLNTYSTERHAVARELIDFDREFAQLISSQGKLNENTNTAGDSACTFQQYFEKHASFTAGTAIQYTASLITANTSHQGLASGFPVGKRFHSAPVIRLADGKPVQIGHTVKADGRWRLFLFADSEQSRIEKLCDYLCNHAASPVKLYTAKDKDSDSTLDCRAIYQQYFRDLDINQMPPLLLPKKGRYQLCDYEKLFCADLKEGNDIFSMRGIDRGEGCLVIVRPDQHVAHVLPLDAFDELGAFFSAFMIEGKNRI